MDTEYLTIAQAAERAGVTRRTIHRWIAAGALPRLVASRGTHRTYINAASLDALTTPQETPL